MSTVRNHLYLVVLAATLGSGCDQEPVDDRLCQLTGWDEGLTVAIVPADAQPLAAGEYLVAIDADGYEISFDLDIEDAQISCLDSVPTSHCLFQQPLSDGGALYVRLDERGGPEDWRLVLNAFYHTGDGWAGGPATARIAITRAGEPIMDETFVPEYSVSEPNGPGCGEATTAHETLILQPTGGS